MTIQTSIVTTFFPLWHVKHKFAPGSPAHNWITLPTQIVGVADLRPRLGTFSTPWQARSHYHLPMPDLSVPEHCSLEDLIDRRSLEIYQIAKRDKKQIVIMWSGGIDSTAVLVSLLKNVPASEQKDLLIICLSPDSVLENLNFYTKYISNCLTIMHKTNLNFDNEFLKKYVLVHGDPADALFAPSSSKYQHLMQDKKHLLPLHTHRHLLYSCFSGRGEVTEQSGRWLVDKIIDNIEQVKPPNVENIAEWFWWQYMNIKWEGCLWFPFHTVDLRTQYKQPIEHEQILSYLEACFFNTDYFQRWSCTNLKRIIPASLQDHKKEIKKYIFDYDKNLGYFNTKSKTVSLSLNFTHVLEKNCLDRPFWYDQHWQGVTLGDPVVFEETMDLLAQYQG
jgi:hypothetical protein